MAVPRGFTVEYPNKIPQGGSSAVKCWGSGALAGVRCIPIGSHTYFWFTVSSGTPHMQLAVQLPARLSSGLPSSVETVLDLRSPQPPTFAAQLSEADAELVLDEKAKAWQFAHHNGVAAPAATPETPALVVRPVKRTRLE